MFHGISIRTSGLVHMGAPIGVADAAHSLSWRYLTPKIAQLNVREVHFTVIVLVVFGIVDKDIAGFYIGVDVTVCVEETQCLEDTPRHVSDLFPAERLPNGRNQEILVKMSEDNRGWRYWVLNLV